MNHIQHHPSSNSSWHRLRALTLGVVLLGTALAAPALTMERMRGAAWLGKPLDVTIQLRLDAGESAAALCLEADVFHGEVRQEPARVRLSTETLSPLEVQVRVQSAVPVEEPVVHLYLRETCVAKTTRRFILLSEFSVDNTTLPALVTAPSATLNSASTSAITSNPPAPSSRTTPVTTSARPTSTTPGKASRPSVAPARAAPPAVSATPIKPTQAQLKLDPVDALSERVAMLEAQRQDAVVPQQPDAAQLKKLEDSVQKLLALTARHERTMAELREQVQQAESEKFSNPLVYGLVVLLVGALSISYYLWRRQPSRLDDAPASQPWWSRKNSEARAEDPLAEITPFARPWSATPSTQAAFSASDMVRFEPDQNDTEAQGSALTDQPHMAAGTDSTGDEPRASLTTLPTLAEAPEASETDHVGRSELDLDDLLQGTVTDTRAASTGEVAPPALPELDYPMLTDPPPAFVAVSTPVDKVAGQEEIPPFPVPQVNIDVSHLSLSPVEHSTTAEPEPLLDFDFTSGRDEKAKEDEKRQS